MELAEPQIGHCNAPENTAKQPNSANIGQSARRSGRNSLPNVNLRPSMIDRTPEGRLILAADFSAPLATYPGDNQSRKRIRWSAGSLQNVQRRTRQRINTTARNLEALGKQMFIRKAAVIALVSIGLVWSSSNAEAHWPFHRHHYHYAPSYHFSFYRSYYRPFHHRTYAYSSFYSSFPSYASYSWHGWPTYRVRYFAPIVYTTRTYWTPTYYVAPIYCAPTTYCYPAQTIQYSVDPCLTTNDSYGNGWDAQQVSLPEYEPAKLYRPSLAYTSSGQERRLESGNVDRYGAFETIDRVAGRETSMFEPLAEELPTPAASFATTADAWKRSDNAMRTAEFQDSFASREIQVRRAKPVATLLPTSSDWADSAIGISDLMIQDGDAYAALQACERMSEIRQQLPAGIYLRHIVLASVHGALADELTRLMLDCRNNGGEFDSTLLPGNSVRKYLSGDPKVDFDRSLDRLAKTALESNRGEDLLAIGILLKIDGQADRASTFASSAIESGLSPELLELARSL